MSQRLLVVLCCLFLTASLYAQSATAKNVFRKLPNGNVQLDDILIRTHSHEFAFPAKFVLANGALEVIIARPDGRLHETLLVTDTSAVKIQTALYLLKAHNGARSANNQNLRQGSLVDIDIEWKDDAGKLHREPIESWIIDNRIHKTMTRIGWVFTGSSVHQGKFLADAEGNIVINWSQGATVLDSPDPQAEDDTLHSVNTAKTQPDDITVVFKPRK